MPKLRAKAFSIWASTLAIGAYIGYKVPPFALIRNITEHHLPDRKKDPLGARMYTKVIETEMMNLPLVKQLLADPRYEFNRAWEEQQQKAIASPPEAASKDDVSSTSNRSGEIFTAQTLQVPGGISAHPIVFVDRETKSSIAIVHVGRKVTGFPMIVHGGILATLLDEALGRTAFLGFPGGVGVTANLRVDYKAPSVAHQFLVIRTHCDEVNEKKTKALVSGTVETLKGKILVKSNAIFVVPKQFTLKRPDGF